MRRICNLTLKLRKLVTHFSLRLGLELLGKENCIGFHPILSDCKVRNPQNLAGSVPNVPTSANLLTQKKEQKSLLLEFVIPVVMETSLLTLTDTPHLSIIKNQWSHISLSINILQRR